MQPEVTKNRDAIKAIFDEAHSLKIRKGECSWDDYELLKAKLTVLLLPASIYRAAIKRLTQILEL